MALTGSRRSCRSGRRKWGHTAKNGSKAITFRSRGSSMATIRPATPEDAEGIARVHIETWRTTYRGLMPDSVLDNLSIEKQADRWDASLSNQRTSTVVAEDG